MTGRGGARRMPVRRYGISLLSEPLEPTGIGRYGIELVRAMAAQLGPRERLVVLRHERFPRPVRHRRVEDVPLRFPAGRSVLRRLVEQTLLVPWAWRARLTLLHTLNHVVPLLAPLPLVVTLHDTRLYEARQEAGAGRRLFRDRVYPLSVRRARRRIVVARSTVERFAQLFGLEPRAFDVIHSGVRRRSERAGPAGPVRQRAGCLLQVGKQEPHKNLERLVQPYALLAHRWRSVAAPTPLPPLVLAGGRGEATEAVAGRVRALGLEGLVRMPGYVSEAQLEALYDAALLFVFPSTLEGFGLPLLEAMAAGVPVAASAIPVFREVAGEAAAYFDPRDERDMAAVLERLLTDARQRQTLIARGRERCGRFTWRATAEATLRLYREVASSRSRAHRGMLAGAGARG